MKLKSEIIKLLKEDWDFRKEVKHILEIDEIEDEISDIKFRS